MAAPSCVLPANLAENCRFLEGIVREVGLALFETESCLGYTGHDLPEDLARLDLDYHVHLPLDMQWSKGSDFVFARVQALLDKVSFLQPDKFVLHPPDSPRDLEDFAHRWLDAGYPPRSLLLENIRDRDLTRTWPVIRSLDLGVCLDLGHILAYGQHGLLDIERLWERVGLLHVYGREKQGRHLGLQKLPPGGEEVLYRILQNIRQGTVILVELFSPEEFESSRDILSALMLKWDMRLDYPDTGRQ